MAASTKQPTPAQLKARRAFTAMAKARAKAARIAKKLANAVPRKNNFHSSTGYKTAGPVRVSGKTFPAGTVFPRNRYVGDQNGREVIFPSKSEAMMWAKAHAQHTNKTVKVKKEELNKNGITYRRIETLTVTPKKQNPRRKNALAPDAAHPIEVTRHWRSGGKSLWQRAHEAGQAQLFKVKNGKRNGTESLAKQRRQEFVGRPSTKTLTMYAPKGSGAKGTLVAMGRLLRLHIRGRAPIAFSGDSKHLPTLAHDPKTDQMFVLGNTYNLSALKKSKGTENLGAITCIEYVATKSHLGDTQPTTYYHKLGEEGGKKPHALINEEGLLLIQGGDYYIRPEGIRN